MITDKINKKPKRPNMCISLGKTLFRKFTYFCSNKNSDRSRELREFIDKVISEDKIEDKYIDEQKTEKISISIEDSKSRDFKRICKKYNAYYTTVLVNFMKEETDVKKK